MAATSYAFFSTAIAVVGNRGSKPDGRTIPRQAKRPAKQSEPDRLRVGQNPPMPGYFLKARALQNHK